MKKPRKRDVLAEFANAMTSEQYIAWLNTFDPISDELRQLSDDNLLKELHS